MNCRELNDEKLRSLVDPDRRILGFIFHPKVSGGGGAGGLAVHHSFHPFQLRHPSVGSPEIKQ
jgi:hypothetical protein